MKNRSKHYDATILLISIFLTSFCSKNNLDKEAKLDIQEAVFLYQFGRPADLYCISTEDGKDPSEELMRRFVNHNPPVKKYSECNKDGNDQWSSDLDSVPNNKVIYFSIHSVTLKARNKAESKAGWSRGPLWGESHYYLLKFSNEKWTVVEDEIVAVS